MDGRDRGRNSFAVAYRGHKTCPSWSFTAGKMERADLEALWARYGDDTTVSDFVAMSRCAKCGGRWPEVGITITPDSPQVVAKPKAPQDS